MKFFIATFLSLLALNTYAEPNDNLALKYIGRGSKIILEKDINIPEGMNHVYLQTGWAN